MSFKHTARKTSRGGGGKHPPMRIRVNPIVVGLFDSPILVGGKKAPLPNS